jgi:hypothetical protein
MKNMSISGRVHGGVVVLEGGASLPEGTPVTVSCYVAPSLRGGEQPNRIQVPLVRTGNPASVNLTEERLSQLLDDEDVSAGH